MCVYILYGYIPDCRDSPVIEAKGVLSVPVLVPVSGMGRRTC